ncbi:MULTISPECIES: hypothetical protein [Variovorax]|nr:hypothetical protein [Variovorax sp. KBS0712]
MVHFSTARASRGTRKIVTSLETNEAVYNGFGPVKIRTVKKHRRK